MNLEVLKTKLDTARISKHAYSFFGDGIGECYVLTKEGPDWLVYYSERGERQGLKHFQSESEACDHFLAKVMTDPTTRQRP